MPIEQGSYAAQLDRRQGHPRALRVAEEGDAIGIDERQGREIKQRAIGIGDAIGGGTSPDASLLDPAWTEAVDSEQDVAQRREARAGCVLGRLRISAVAAMERDHRREGARADRAVEV